jgi:hypothetical protein
MHVLNVDRAKLRRAVNSRYYAKKKAALTNVLPTPIPSETLGYRSKLC